MMFWLKQGGAVLAGFATMSVAVLVGSVAITLALGRAPDEAFTPGLADFAMNGVVTALAAWAGARVAVRLSSSPIAASALLGAVMTVMSMVTLVVGHGDVDVPATWTLLELVIGLAVVAWVARSVVAGRPR